MKKSPNLIRQLKRETQKSIYKKSLKSNEKIGEENRD